MDRCATPWGNWTMACWHSERIFNLQLPFPFAFSRELSPFSFLFLRGFMTHAPGCAERATSELSSTAAPALCLSPGSPLLLSVRPSVSASSKKTFCLNLTNKAFLSLFSTTRYFAALHSGFVRSRWTSVAGCLSSAAGSHQPGLTRTVSVSCWQEAWLYQPVDHHLLVFLCCLFRMWLQLAVLERSLVWTSCHCLFSRVLEGVSWQWWATGFGRLSDKFLLLWEDVSRPLALREITGPGGHDPSPLWQVAQDCFDDVGISEV